MARLKSSEKRDAILQAAVGEIAEAGLGAATAKIARRADVAAGTLFTYFVNKDELLNELYLELKGEVYSRVNESFPHKGSLERRVKHIWVSYLGWAVEYPLKRKVSVQLNVSDVITAATRSRAAEARGLIDRTLRELGERESLRELPSGFAVAMMSSLQDAVMEFIAKKPKQQEMLTERAFEVFWRAVR
ncbi:TetR/AcrR family transcriptional regulator [Granulicella tundricola]|nr:TetR/AcrR family transcriptional regulator [Granulicella tundricola]